MNVEKALAALRAGKTVHCPTDNRTMTLTKEEGVERITATGTKDKNVYYVPRFQAVYKNQPFGDGVDKPVPK